MPHDSRLASALLVCVGALFLASFLSGAKQSAAFEDGRMSPNTSMKKPVPAGEMPGVLPINTLAVRIITSGESRSGTNNAVYFDIGPLAWKLNKRNHNDFEKGADDTYQLPLPAGTALTTADILWLRLRKKGIFGVSGTGDGLGGAWKPSRIYLIVNNVEYAEYAIERPLNSKNPEWKAELRRFTSEADAERFVFSLRLVPNSRVSWFDRRIARLTTPLFKERGISGWIRQGLPISCATGTVIRAPALSDDGLATIDLRLERIEVGDRRFVLDGQHGVPHVRFIRVEYRRRRNPVPQSGQRVRICGEVKWDTDREGWHEIHPRGAEDVTVLF